MSTNPTRIALGTPVRVLPSQHGRPSGVRLPSIFTEGRAVAYVTGSVLEGRYSVTPGPGMPHFGSFSIEELEPLEDPDLVEWRLVLEGMSSNRATVLESTLSPVVEARIRAELEELEETLEELEAEESERGGPGPELVEEGR